MALQRRPRDNAADDLAESAAAVPGKQTQIDRLAAQGVSGTGGAMPFADAITSSFGPAHADTVRGIQAHTGSAATAASEDLGARGYATGNRVAFAGSPDLHTAAHEAAHVVQQRQGVHLKGGVGASGDVYERHADAVADRVVAGQSAAELLGAPGSSGAAAVQRKDAKPSKADEKKAHEQFESDGPMVVYALSGVFHDQKAQMDYMPSKYVDAMNKLYTVKYGAGKSGHQHALAGRDRRALLDEVWPIFEPFAQANTHFEADWDGLPAAMTRLRADVLASEASDRVENSITFTDEAGQKKAVDMPDDKHPQEQAEVLKGIIPTIVGSVKRTIETAKKKADAAGIHKDQIDKLGANADLLVFAEQYLTMSDQELKLHIDTIKAKATDVTDKASFVKKAISWASYAMKGTLTISEQLMKLVGDKMMAVEIADVAKGMGDAFGSVLSVVQIVHGISVLCDDNASRDDKIGGGVEIAGGVAFLVGGGPASMAITGPYMLVKGAQYLLSEATIGWETGLVREAFQSMQHDAGLIGKAMEHLAAAQLMARDEKDQERKAALGHEADVRLDALRSLMASFLSGTEYRDHGSDYQLPGNIPIISDAFGGPRAHLAGAHTQEQLLTLSHEISQQIGWCFKNGPAIVKATATHKDIVDVEGIESDLEAHAKDQSKSS